MFEYNDIGITWTGHAGFKITFENKTMYIDPYKLSKKYDGISDADIVLVTHNHFDHLSIEDLNNIINERTVIVSAQECLPQLKPLKIKESIGIDPNNSVKVDDLKIETVPAYNVNKDFHPKNEKTWIYCRARKRSIIPCRRFRYYSRDERSKANNRINTRFRNLCNDSRGGIKGNK